MRISPVYGPHPSRCLGISLGVDPVNFTRRCYMACALCHSRYWPLVSPHYNSGEILNAVKERAVSLKPSSILVGGSSDPILYDESVELVKGLRESVEEAGLGAKIAFRTLGYFHRALGEILRSVDLVLIPVFVADSDWLSLYNPAIQVNKSDYYERVKKLVEDYKEHKNKIVFEVVLAKRTSEQEVAERAEEALVFLEKIRAHSVFIKTLDRPPRDERYRPVTAKFIERLVEHFVERGLSASACPARPPVAVKGLGRAQEEVFNHVLRKPLSTQEIAKLYGDLGVTAAEALVRRGVLTKVLWERTLFFAPSPPKPASD